MANIVGVCFKPRGKLLYCDAADISLQFGDYVVVDTSHGLDLAKVVAPEARIPQSDLSEQLMRVVRLAKIEDLEKARQNQENEALAKCHEMVTNLGLKMKPLAAHSDLKGGRVTIFFSAKERVDFRGLVRRLSHSLETHVSLRQTGPRDEAKLIGGIGKCGYPLCCQSFITDFPSVSIRMAKEQGLALNPMKVSGVCGRLLCCLAYESKEYSDIKERMPRLGQEVSTPFGKAKVVSVSPIKETVSVELKDQTIRELPLDQLA
ncbi:MAG: stage 0 sporulation family protein [Dehalococcoidia bacterium]|nr:stage 0 sporulation family protein [Dehalococcoidia bacterium]